MKYIKFYASLGYCNADEEDIIKYENDITNQEIEDDWKEWINGVLDSGWYEVDGLIKT